MTNEEIVTQLFGASTANKLRAMKDFSRGLVDTGASLAVSGAGQTAAGLGGVGAGVAELLRTRDFGKAGDALVDVYNKTSEGAAREPTTDMGRRSMENIGKATGAVGDFLKENIADRAADIHPALGAALVAVPEVIGNKVKAKTGATPKRAFDPAREYPPAGEPKMVPHDDGRPGLRPKKSQSEEGKAVAKVRNEAQRDIDRGEYDPYFDVSKRSYVDPKHYPMDGVDTATQNLPRTYDTTGKYHDIAYDPAAMKRMEDAFGTMADNPKVHDWYAMKQLEDEYIKHLGPKLGRAAFESHFKSHAAFTGGVDPKANLVFAQYGDFMNAKGDPFPKSAGLPYPIGGPYVAGNLKLFDKLVRNNEPWKKPGEDMTRWPKRENFAAAHLGHPNAMTIDEQGMRVWHPNSDIAAPENLAYGIYQNAMTDAITPHLRKGEPASSGQGVLWYGLKDQRNRDVAATNKSRPYKEPVPKPEIENYNEAIERTRRITGASPEEIVREGLVKKRMPIYGMGAAGATGAAALAARLREEDEGI